MHEIEVGGREIALIKTPYPLPPEEMTELRRQVGQYVATGQPLVVPPGFEVVFRDAKPQMIPLADHQARVNELLTANSGYVERARWAEAKLRALGIKL